MKKNGVVRKSTLLFYIALMCLVSYALLENVTISIPAFSVFKRPLLFLAGICLVERVKFLYRNFLRKEYFIELIFLFLFIITVIYSCLVNLKTISGYRPIAITINFVIFLVELITLIMYAAENGLMKNIFNFIFKYIIILTFITDILMFSGLQSFSDGMFETYLIGTKFSVSYLHIFLLSFYLLNRLSDVHLKTRYIWFLVLFSGAVIAVAMHVDCNTGVIGCLLLIFFVLLFNIYPKTWLQRFSSVPIFLLFLIGCTVIAFIFEYLVKLAFIENIIVNTLNRNTTLTGRIDIYSLFFLKLVSHWKWGYGLGSAYAMSMSLFGYADAQNALLQWILQIGVLPVVFLILFFSAIIKNLSKKDNLIAIMPVISLMYVLIILGAVEITFNMNFFLLMIIIFGWSHEQSMRGRCNEDSNFINAEGY